MKEGGKPCCSARGSTETFEALKEELARRGLSHDVKVVSSGCLDLCDRGPTVLVYPEGIWYSGLTAEHVSEFVECQIVEGKRFEKKACDEMELKDFFEKRKARKKVEEKNQRDLNNSSASRSS